MPANTQRVWYITDARANVNFTTGFTVTSADPNLYTVNGNVTRLTAEVWNTGSGDKIGNVRSQDWFTAGDVINAQTLKIAKDEASSTTPPAVVVGTPTSSKGSWGVRTITGNYTLTVKDYPNVLIKSTSATAVTITVPADLPFPLETPIRWRQVGAGQITFSPATNVTISSLSGNKKSSAQHAGGEISRATGNTWHLSGGLVA